MRNAKSKKAKALAQQQPVFDDPQKWLGLAGITLTPLDEGGESFRVKIDDSTDKVKGVAYVSYKMLSSKRLYMPMAVFAANKIIIKGEKRLYRELEKEALRLWSWTRPNGKPLGRLPTELQARLGLLSRLFCKIYAACWLTKDPSNKPRRKSHSSRTSRGGAASHISSG
jgi:hypothetical protein